MEETAKEVSVSEDKEIEAGAVVIASTDVADVAAFQEAIGTVNAPVVECAAVPESSCVCGVVLGAGVHRAGADCILVLRVRLALLLRASVENWTRDQVMTEAAAIGWALEN